MMWKGIKSTWITRSTRSKANLKVSKESIMTLLEVVSSNTPSSLKSVEWTVPSLLTTTPKKYTATSTLGSSKLSTDFLGINLTSTILSSSSQNF